MTQKACHVPIMPVGDSMDRREVEPSAEDFQRDKGLVVLVSTG